MKENIKEIVCDVFDIKEEDYSENISKFDYEKWDSLGHINLISSLEGKFDIKFKPEEIININSVKDIEEHIERHIK